MPDISFNPLATARAFEAAGIDRPQAEVIANAINHSTESALEKADIESLVASTHMALNTIRWVISIQSAAIAALLGTAPWLLDRYL